MVRIFLDNSENARLLSINRVIMDEIQSVDNIARHPVDTLKTPQPKNKRVIDGQWINDNQRSQCLTNIKHKINYEIFI